MSDDLLVPDPKTRIVSPADAKRIADRNAKYDADGNRKIPPADVMSSMVSRDEAMKIVARATAEATNKAMAELDEALADRLDDMEKVITENVVRALVRRTWRYRLTMWARGWLVELGVIEPVQLAPQVDAVEAMDPNVQAAAVAEATGMPTWREFPSGIDASGIHYVEANNIIAIVRKPGSAEWYVIAGTTENLKRACAELGGENLDFEEGVTSALLDAEFLDRARRIIARQDGTARITGLTEQ